MRNLNLRDLRQLSVNHWWIKLPLKIAVELGLENNANTDLNWRKVKWKSSRKLEQRTSNVFIISAKFSVTFLADTIQIMLLNTEFSEQVFTFLEKPIWILFKLKKFLADIFWKEKKKVANDIDII